MGRILRVGGRFVRVGGRRGAGAGYADPRPVLSSTPTRNPGGVIASATVLGRGQLEVVTAAGATSSSDPASMGIWEFDLFDLLGNEVDDSDGVDLGDMWALSVWTSSAVGVEDVMVMGGLVSASIDGSDLGVAGGFGSLAADAGVWRARHRSATGAAWTAETAATATSGLTTGAQLQGDLIGTAGTQNRLSVVPLDASGSPITTANVGTAPGTVTGQADWKKGFIGVSAGAVARTVRVGVSLLLVRPREVEGWYPFELGAPSAPPATYSKIRLAPAHSMGEGTVISAAWGGQPVPAGWDFYDDAVATDPFPAGVPGVGMVPYLMAEADAFVRPASGTKWVARDATNGNAMGAGFDARLASALSTKAALGHADLWIVWAGANDAQDTTELELYRGPHGLERIIQLIRHEDPDAVIALMGERTADAVVYPHIADGTINTEKQRLAAAYPYVYYVSAEGITLADSIHPADVGGYDTMASRLFEELP
jgi:hypothetical protein